MRSPDAARSAAKVLIFMALGAAFPVSTSAAAPRCPLGQILRVSKGVCVPKAENLALISKHAAKPTAPATETQMQEEEEEAEAASDAAPARPRPVHASRPDHIPLVEVAQREAPSTEQQPGRSSAEAGQAAPSSPFGSLFVGAFRSTLTMGLSVSK